MSSEDLSTGDAIFLAFLTLAPMSAYDIKRAMAVSVSFFWSAAHSQVYQQAARLARDGMISEREAPGARRKRILSLTPKGRAAVNRWLRSSAEPPELRDEMLAKLFFAARGDTAKTLAMLEDQRDKHAHRLAEFEGIQVALHKETDANTPYQLMTLELGLKVERAYREWLNETIARLETQLSAE